MAGEDQLCPMGVGMLEAKEVKKGFQHMGMQIIIELVDHGNAPLLQHGEDPLHQHIGGLSTAGLIQKRQPETARIRAMNTHRHVQRSVAVEFTASTDLDLLQLDTAEAKVQLAQQLTGPLVKRRVLLEEERAVEQPSMVIVGAPAHLNVVGEAAEVVDQRCR